MLLLLLSKSLPEITELGTSSAKLLGHASSNVDMLLRPLWIEVMGLEVSISQILLVSFGGLLLALLRVWRSSIGFPKVELFRVILVELCRSFS
jgi:hypothetical protein